MQNFSFNFITVRFKLDTAFMLRLNAVDSFLNPGVFVVIAKL